MAETKLVEISPEQLTQELAVLRKRFTGKTAPYDRTISILQSMPQEQIAPQGTWLEKSAFMIFKG